MDTQINIPITRQALEGLAKNTQSHKLQPSAIVLSVEDFKPLLQDNLVLFVYGIPVYASRGVKQGDIILAYDRTE